MSESNQRPIIIKRKKVSGGGHHGGAWKVAYADFVTAMMAFFMLMWLLGATTDDQRKGLADYFSPTISISRTTGGGDGAFGGVTQTAARATTQDGSGGITTSNLHGFGEGAEVEAADAAMREVAEAVLGRGGDSVVEELDRRNVTVRLTDAGLVIEMFDLPGSPLFEPSAAGAPVPTPLLLRLLATVAGQAARTEGGVALDAHVSTAPLVVRDRPVWDASLARAQALRAALVRAGLDERRIRRMTGHGDRTAATEPAIAPRNNRVEVILLRPDA